MQEKADKSAKLAQIQTYILYYESKISCLNNKKLSPSLHMLACKDAPFEPGSLEAGWRRNWYMKRCLKYYTKKLKETQKELKKLK